MFKISYYAPYEHLAVEEVIILLKRQVIFRQYTPKKHERFGIKIYKLCNMSGYSYNLGKDKTLAARDMTVTHVTVKQLTKMLEGRGHELYMDNFFSSLNLFNYLAEQKVSCCGTVRPNRTGMPQKLLPQNK
jgi:hypothetical protein